MKTKKIAIFTAHYPFDRGETFFEDELKIAERYFKKICLISFAKEPKDITKYVPKNAEVIPVRKNISNRQMFLKRLSGIFSLDVWRQTFFCVRERGIRSFFLGLKNALIDRSTISVLKANEHLWAGKYDVYYAYWLGGDAAYLAMRKQYLKGIVIARAHGGDCFFDRTFHPHRKEQFSGLDVIYPISDAGKMDLKAQGCDSEKIHVARLGFNKGNNKLNPYRSGVRKTIVTCSNIIHLKRLDLMIDALAGIDDIDIHWVHFGDGELRDVIASMAKEKLGRKSNIFYEFKGFTLQKDIFEFYQTQSVDLFVNCSDHEGIPVSVMEAMSYGIPCIARDAGGNREIVDSECGIFLEKKSTSEDVREAIKSVLTLSEAETEILRTNAVKKVNEKFNAVNNYKKFFEEIVNL